MPPEKDLHRSQWIIYTFILIELVIMAGTVMLAYYFEYTDTFNVHVQGFFCYDNSYTKPYLGPEESSAIPPALLYAVVAGVPTLVITLTESVLFLLQYTSKDLDSREKTIVTGDCCYLNPLVRRTFRFLGVYTFGLFTTDIFVNAGQVVTGNLAPHFLTVCKPNYTALGCQQALRFISHQEACTGNEEDILRARKTFPSKEAALSVYAALYLAMYITCTVKAKGTRLAKPVLSLGLMCLAFLTGINRVAEYRNHWSDVIAGFIIGVAIATFLVVCVVHNFQGKLLLNDNPPQDNLSNTPMINLPRVESPLEKYIASQVLLSGPVLKELSTPSLIQAPSHS
ncbi:phospholipid phosphatase-related protein type 5 isoform X1 [Megalops cyprinoides]|uniref:phospholipid phosphatase-related protein type 5 isoform X1 n=1 Tax=Megalops cyprinoides TaxID=118141 RepID=UPI001864633E|nr:phospholipid phosphatase-related protein type 5 isoform X1 [Megalops cyprinoides]